LIGGSITWICRGRWNGFVAVVVACPAPVGSTSSDRPDAAVQRQG
jgi:hypothetical protein